MTAWRTIVTDSESLTGVAPVCGGSEHTREPGSDLSAWVFNCCLHPQLETWSEATAKQLAETLNAAAGQPVQACDGNGDPWWIHVCGNVDMGEEDVPPRHHNCGRSDPWRPLLDAEEAAR